MTFKATVLNHWQTAKESVKINFIDVTTKAREVGDNWQQATTQNTENAIDTFNHTIEQAKVSLEENLPQVSVQTAVNSSFADWFARHPAFSGILKSFNWAISHPIISFIIFIFSLAILWSLIKAIGRLIEKASLSILQIPLKILQAFIKYCWVLLGKFSNFVGKKITNTKISDSASELQLQNNADSQIICNKQKKLKDISARLEEIQAEQQELLQEAADILDAEEINS